MLSLTSNRALLHGMLAGALVLAGASACSRSDRNESGQANNATVLPDTSTAVSDTMAHTGTHSGAVGDTAATKTPADAPRAATAPPSAERQDASLETDSAAGYRAMERDTAGVPESDSARVTQDTSETSQTTDTASVESSGASQPSDTVSAVAVEDTVAVATQAEMARDTSGTADQIDTTGAAADASGSIQVSVDTANAGAEITADTAGNAGRIRPPEDSTEILGQVTGDTSTTVATADTMESERIRPPEDSTELAGVNSAETADEEPVDEAEQIEAESPEAVASRDRTDEVGAAAVSADITGTQAVSLVTRQGTRCIMVDPESDEEVRWDMTITPVTVNPCGLGTMTLSKVETAGSGSQE